MSHTPITYKQRKATGFFDEESRLAKISQLGDTLEDLSNNIDFEIFRNILESGLRNEPKGPGGRRPYDYVLMFKTLIVKSVFNISFLDTEKLMLDSIRVCRFLNLSLSDDVPDSNTISNFHNRLSELGLIEKLFFRFNKELDRLGLFIKEGKIMDATIIEVPRQRNSEKENEEIKSGKIPERFEANPSIKPQKDTDARWTQKHNKSYYGYKDHIVSDSGSKLILNYVVTDASVHDSQVLEELLPDIDTGECLYGDKAYSGSPQNAIILKKGYKNRVCHRSYAGRPLRSDQVSSNQRRSRIRSRVEHIFGFIKGVIKGGFIRSIGIRRARASIGLSNLIYNMFRKVQLVGT
jgi:IS5 family transposase